MPKVGMCDRDKGGDANGGVTRTMAMPMDGVTEVNTVPMEGMYDSDESKANSGGGDDADANDRHA